MGTGVGGCCWLADHLRDDEPLADALWILLTVGLIWQFVLVLILLRRERWDHSNGRGRGTHFGSGHREVRRADGWWRQGVVVGGAICRPCCLWAMVPRLSDPSARDFE